MRRWAIDDGTRHPPESARRCRWAVLCSLILCPPIALAMSFLPIPFPPSQQSTSPPRDPSATTIDRVVVKKAERRLYLMQGDTPMRDYPVALGFKPEGHKRREGDGRTPEGRYQLDWRNPRSNYHRSLHISYPDPLDRRRADARGQPPGGMIMIHGQPNGASGTRTGDWTQGCIAVSNPAIEEIWSLVADGTPIEILP